MAPLSSLLLRLSRWEREIPSIARQTNIKAALSLSELKARGEILYDSNWSLLEFTKTLASSPETDKSLIVLFVCEARYTANPFHLPTHINVIFWSGRLMRRGISYSTLAVGHPHEVGYSLQPADYPEYFLFFFWKIVGQAAYHDLTSPALMKRF